MSKVLSAAKWSLELLAKRISSIRVQKVFPVSKIYGSSAYDESEMMESEPFKRDQKAELFYDCWSRSFLSIVTHPARCCLPCCWKHRKPSSAFHQPSDTTKPELGSWILFSRCLIADWKSWQRSGQRPAQSFTESPISTPSSKHRSAESNWNLYALQAH